MKKVLVTSRSFGKVSKKPLEILEDVGIEYTLMGSNFDEEKFRKILPQYDALIIGAHKFDPEDMRRCSKLQIIAKHGTGLDNIDLKEAEKLGITVTNVPAMNANAVADLAFAHILNICRGVSVANEKVHDGEWRTFTGKDVYKKVLGLVGFGSIAKNVTQRALGFSMKVIVYDPFVKEIPEELKEFVKLVDFDTVLKESDIISIHTPLTEKTKNLFNKETIGKMKKEAYLVNTARGGIINEIDLYECMKSGHLNGAALDVIEIEPIKRDNPLLTLENVVITPHMGMYSIEAMNAVSIACVENVVKKLQGETPNYIVVQEKNPNYATI